jgi:AraC-like DNA-binding protein
VNWARDALGLCREMRPFRAGPVEIVRPVARDSLLALHFATLFACLPAAQPDRVANEESLLRTLMCLLRRHGIPRPAAIGPCLSVANAIRHLDSAPDSQVSLAELAALSGVTRFQLLRAFAREVGITPRAYLVQRRVLLAQRLLAEGQTPAQAAILAGSADQTRLTRAFVRHRHNARSLSHCPGLIQRVACNSIQDLAQPRCDLYSSRASNAGRAWVNRDARLGDTHDPPL